MQSARRWTKRIWVWIEHLSIVTSLLAFVGGSTVLGLLYSFVGAYRQLPIAGQAFFGLATFATAGLVAMGVVKMFFTPEHAELPSTSTELEEDPRYLSSVVEQQQSEIATLTGERDSLTLLLDVAKGEVEAQGHVIAVREKERDQAVSFHQKEMQAAEAFRRENEDLKQRLAVVEADSLKHLKSTFAATRDVEALRPKADWADSLLDRERVWPKLVWPSLYNVWKVNHLDDPSPYLEIEIVVQYHGVLRLTIDVSQRGRLSWNGYEFSQEPVITHSQSEELPYVSDGPCTAQIRLRQFVDGRRDELKKYLENHPRVMQFGTARLEISMRFETFDGIMVKDDVRLLGAEFTAGLVWND